MYDRCWSLFSLIGFSEHTAGFPLMFEESFLFPLLFLFIIYFPLLYRMSLDLYFFLERIMCVESFCHLNLSFWKLYWILCDKCFCYQVLNFISINLPGICFPMGRGVYRVVHIPEDESILLNSREKAPYMISVEVLKAETSRYI